MEDVRHEIAPHLFQALQSAYVEKNRHNPLDFLPGQQVKQVGLQGLIFVKGKDELSHFLFLRLDHPPESLMRGGKSGDGA